MVECRYHLARHPLVDVRCKASTITQQTLKAIVEKKTVRYASELANLYALIPVASMEGVNPGTMSKAAGVPTVMADRNAATDEAGNPAAMGFGVLLLGPSSRGDWQGWRCR